MEFINKKIEELKNHLEDLNSTLIDNEFLTKIERHDLFIKAVGVRSQIRTLEWVLTSKKNHDLEIASTSVQIKMYQLHEVEEAFDRWLNSKDVKIPFTDFLRGKQTFPENKIS
ncbi:hypothetical protein OBK01_02630 [Empedobacter falsenii]